MMKILLVDDHPLIREALHHVLQQLADHVELLDASSGELALDIVEQHPDLDLVLLDLGLPGMGGSGTLNSLSRSHPQLPVVVLSATDDPEVVTHALERGAMGFIPKSSGKDIMLSALRLVMSGGIYVPQQALQHSPIDRPRDGMRRVTPHDLGLTERQADVLALMVQGKPNKQICRELNLAEGTVKVHVTGILRALNASNRTQAVVAAGRLGLDLPPGAPRK